MREKVLFSLFLSLSLLTPSIKLGDGIPSLRLEFLVALVPFALNGFRIKHSSKFIRTLFYLIFAALFSIAIGYAFFDVPFNFKDFMIIPMILEYIVIISFGIMISRNLESSFLLKSSFYIFLIAVIFGFFQMYNILGVKDNLVPLYFEEEGLRYYLMDDSRTTGTVGDPRHYCFLLVVGFNLMLVSFNIVSRGIKWFILSLAMILTVWVILSTASRTGLLAMFLSVIIYYGLLENNFTFIIKRISYLLIISPILLFIWSNGISDTQKERLFSTETDSFDGSLYARKRDNLEFIERFNSQPLTIIAGIGPAKSVLPGSEHSDIGWFIIRFGILGFFIYFLFLFEIAKKIKGMYLLKNKESIILSGVGLAVFVPWLVYVFAESIFKHNQLMSVIIIICVFVVSKYSGVIKISK